MIDTFFTNVAADIKGALAGGVVACILDRGSFYRRAFNCAGSVIISMACTKGVLDIAGETLPKTDNVVMLFAAVFALVGIVAAEILQRIARRVLGRADNVADRVIDKYAGKADDDAKK